MKLLKDLTASSLLDLLMNHILCSVNCIFALLPLAADLPREVDNYHNLVPLEPPPVNPMQKSSTFGYQTSTYKATNTKDGLVYCLRRIHGASLPRHLLVSLSFFIVLSQQSGHLFCSFVAGFRLNSTKCMSIIDLWKKMQHANIVQLRQVFTTKAFGDHCEYDLPWTLFTPAEVHSP